MSPNRKILSQWLQYLYFLRFPILGWLLLPALCYLDGCTGVSTVTRGIMTLSGCWQAFHAAFFITALMMAVLICSRNIVRNGRIRFGSAPPPSLRRALTKPTTRIVWISLALAHVPTALVLGYIAATTIREREPGFGYADWKLWGSYGLGLLISLVFWYLVSLFYLWTYPAEVHKAPSALLFPGTTWGFTSAQNTSQPRVAVWIEAAARKALWFTHTGYAASDQGPLWELHSLTAVSLSFFLLLYLFLYPLIAPVVVSNGRAEAVLAVCIVLIFAYGARKRGKPGGVDYMGVLFTSITLLLLCIFLGYLFYDVSHHRVVMETAFPTIASLLVILIFFLWLFSGASFLFDRYRVPVLTIAVLVILIPKYIPVDQEHYFATKATTRIDTVDAPSDAIAHRLRNQDEPYIVVTASGGGIQAAEWTAEVLSQLEKRFRDDSELNGPGRKGYLFHDHLLLASGVSGGSVGLMPYLLEYTASPVDAFTGSGKDLDRRLTTAPGCSSLEAVAWGMEYYDLQRFLFTVRLPWIQSTSDGDAPDRTWALSEAINRNLNDKTCGSAEIAKPQGLMDGEEMTLKRAAERLRVGSMPAFVFNTTVAETGGRFLLSNYAIPPTPLSNRTGPLEAASDFLPAESFLQAYTQESHCDQGNLNDKCYADVSLATAARLSATFPVVSSGTRVSWKYAGAASHFLDGGYFDNDGTASVIEFLYSAMRQRTNRSKLKVLLIEIRDSDDLNPTQNMDDWKHQNGLDLEVGTKQPKAWTSNTQFIAPFLGMWNAGHVSITRRNRRELCTLETAFAATNQLELHHVVLGITAEPKTGRPGQYKTAPLSWKLTASQKEYIRSWAEHPDKPTQQTINEALAWVKRELNPGQPAPDVVDTGGCEVVDQTYMRR
jgi:hypothetical protein